MKAKKFLESKETYNKVIEIINDHFKDGRLDDDIRSIMTENMFICGGAVSNILYHLFHKTEKPVINDIDIFVIDKTNRGGFESPTIKSEELICDEGYNFAYTQEDGSSYHVLNEKKDGILNWVEVFIDNFGDNHNQEVILNGFDLNCTKSGISISEEKIIYTDDFLKFLEDRQLKIAAPHTPLQTMIRLFKKVDDLGCYCNVDLEYDLLCNMFIVEGVKHTIGEVTYEKYLKYKDKVDQYFTVVKADLSKYKGQIENSGIGFNQMDRFLKDFFGYTDYRKFGIQATHYNKQLWFYLPSKKVKTKYYLGSDRLSASENIWVLMNRDIRKIEKERLNLFLDKTELFTKITGTDEVMAHRLRNIESKIYKLNVLEEMGIEHNIEFEYVTESLVVRTVVRHGKDFINCDISKKQADIVKKFIRSHPRVWHRLPKKGKNFRFCYEQILKLKALVKKEGDWVIGEFENFDNGPFERLLGNDELGEKNYSFERFKIVVENRKKEMLTPLIESLDLTGFSWNGCVNELVTSLTLKAEGKKMGHCVGGYTGSVKNGSSRIFHIECDGIGSTVEISKKEKLTHRQQRFSEEGRLEHNQRKPIEKKGGDHYYVKQHYGRFPEKGNLTPTDLNKGIAEELCEYLTKRYLKKEPIQLDLFHGV